jgi:hypothetical protein
LNAELTGKPGAFKGVTYTELVDIGLGEEYGMLVAILGDGSGKVVKLTGENEKEGGITSLWDFMESVRLVTYSLLFPLVFCDTDVRVGLGFDRPTRPCILHPSMRAAWIRMAILMCREFTGHTFPRYAPSAFVCYASLIICFP